MNTENEGHGNALKWSLGVPASSNSSPAAVSSPQMRKCRTNVEWLILGRSSCVREVFFVRYFCRIHLITDQNCVWKDLLRLKWLVYSGMNYKLLILYRVSTVLWISTNTRWSSNVTSKWFYHINLRFKLTRHVHLYYSTITYQHFLEENGYLSHRYWHTMYSHRSIPRLAFISTLKSHLISANSVNISKQMCSREII